MTKPVVHFEAPHLALWKSAVVESLARGDRGGAAADADHPVVTATDRYLMAMARNEPPRPPSDRTDEQAVLAYLSFMHHRRAHARIADAPAMEAEVQHQLDEYTFGNPPWQRMFEQYLEYYWQYPYHLGGPPMYRSWQDPQWGAGDLGFGVVTWELPAHARVAIVGDVGTGTDVAAGVLAAAVAMRPDAILHLGDVYYSGTAWEMRHRLVDTLAAVQADAGTQIPFFTVPGNHEYFSGAAPFLDTLDSGRLVTTADQRQVASYFCVRTEDAGWQFLGLDTGFHGHYLDVPPTARQAALRHLHVGDIETPQAPDEHWVRDTNPYLRGDVELPVTDLTHAEPVLLRPDELEWHLDKLRGFPGRSILLSHHQLYSAVDVCGPAQGQRTGADGVTTADPADFARAWVNTGLWRQLGATFGDHVAAWIWGHEHNLGVFRPGYRPADWPTTGHDATEVFKTLPLGRCAGHGAIPVAEKESPYAHTYPVDLVGPEAELGLTDGWYNHGFELLELHGAGRPAQITYFQIAGVDPDPILVHREVVS